MRIGIDFDNTIVCHDDMFHLVARERGWIPAELPASKESVRNHLRAIGQERLWTELQGVIYGSRLHDAAPFPGAKEFFERCRRDGVQVCVISHRTRAPILGAPFDLHQAARDWLRERGFLSPAPPGIDPADVYLEVTKEDKLDRIARLGCSWFVDDLPEFLDEPRFPAGVRRVLFDPHARHAANPARVGSWNEIERLIFDEGEPPAEAIRELLHQAGGPPEFVLRPLPGGANNRVYHLVAGPFEAALKVYFRHPSDARDRLAAEYSFCGFAWENGIRQVPRPMACDSGRGMALYEFVHGRPLHGETVGGAEVADAIELFRELNACRGRAGGLPAASEACFSLREHLAVVERRVLRLESGADPEAAGFVREQLVPAWKECRERFERGAAGLGLEGPLPAEDRRVSPSDFGFHNAVREPSGRLRFLDFEYAGWDDPAKTVCDFFFQPAVPAPRDSRDRFANAVLEGTADPQRHLRRIALLEGVYRIKWCCILLNEFLPAGVARRRFAGTGAEPRERRASQLAKARALLVGLQT